MKAELAPLVFAELYRALLKEPSYREPLDERLRLIDLDAEWLAEAANAYDRKASELLSILEDSDAPSAFREWPLSIQHSLIAAWLLAALRGTGPSLQFNSELQTAVSRRMEAAAPEIRHVRPTCLRPAVVAWTLGVVAGEYDLTLPVVVAQDPADPNVALAYQGMTEHIVTLFNHPQPWPEMMGTATLWRTSGLAEGLRPEAGKPADAIGQLMAELKPLMAPYTWADLNKHWRDFIEKRNALTHVGAIAGRQRFADCADSATDWEKVRPTVLGLTHFICQQVSRELEESDMGVVHAGIWDTMQWDLYVYEPEAEAH